MSDDVPVPPAAVDPRGDDLAEQLVGVLGAALGVERPAAVTEARVQPAVGAERELAAVVVLLGLVDEQQLAQLARGDRAVLAGAELGDPRVAALVAPVQVEPAVRREVGVEGDAEQALFGPERHAVGEVEQRPPLAARDPDDAAGLLEHPQRAGVARRGADIRGPVQARGDALDGEVARRARLGGGRPLGLELLVAAARDSQQGQDEQAASHCGDLRDT